MHASEITTLLWAALVVFMFSAVAIGRLLRRLPPERNTRLVARLLQGCCCVGVLVCLTGVVVNALR